MKEHAPQRVGAEELRMLVESVQDYAIFMLDTEGRVVSWNRGAERIKGYAPEEIIGRHFSTFYPAHDAESGKPERALEIARDEGRYVEEGWRIRKDGTRFWASVVITALHDAEGTLAGFGKVTRDLSAQREAQDALRQSEERFRLLVQNIRDYAIFMLDTEGRVASWNAGAQRFKGYKAHEIIGRHFSIFYPVEDVVAGRPERELQLARAEGHLEDEGWRVRKDGSRFWANVVITALYDDNGLLRGFGKVTRDLTQSKEQDDMRSRFIAHAAHELRTPVSVIVGFISYLLESGQALPPELAEILSALGRQGARMHTLVNNLLDLTQLEQGRMSLDVGSTRVDSAIERVAHLAPPPGEQVVKLDLVPTTVLADADRLEQVFMNLLTNAYHYGGDHITIIARDAGPNVRIEFCDDGPGVPAVLLERLFEPFHRGPDTAAVEGSGLGLTIVRGLVEAFNGTIAYRPKDGGARFVIEIPKAP